MLNSFVLAGLIGTVFGFLSGLGVGGGSLLMVWLTVVLHTPQEIARAINLLFFIPSAVISSIYHWKQGSLNLSIVLPAILTGSITALLGSWLSGSLDSDFLKTGFAFLLLATGLRELFYRPRKFK